MSDIRLCAYACVVTNENRDLFSHLAEEGTGYIGIDYDFINPPKITEFLGDHSYSAGHIHAYSDGYCSCEIFDPEYAALIGQDYKEISGEESLPKEVFTTTSDLDKTRFKRMKEFLDKKGVTIVYSQDLQVELEIAKRNHLI